MTTSNIFFPALYVRPDMKITVMVINYLFFSNGTNILAGSFFLFLCLLCRERTTT